MKIESSVEKDVLTMKVQGRLDTTTAPDLEVALMEKIPGMKTIILDCEGLEYISSAGLRVLLSTMKYIGDRGEMKLIHVNDTIMDIFEITGFTDILTIE
ncbi:MAG: STAS domain-containing protein [Erysipelotrichaceae bacterium]|nr:STAS domain-containing protein [Erysipelotrichaceae bacterium]